MVSLVDIKTFSIYNFVYFLVECGGKQHQQLADKTSLFLGFQLCFIALRFLRYSSTLSHCDAFTVRPKL